MKKQIASYFIIGTLLLSLTGCSNTADIEKLKEKNTKELEFLDSKIINIANKLNNIKLQKYVLTKEKNEKITEKTSTGEGNNEEEQEDTSKEDIYTTKLNPNTVLEGNTTDIDWEYIKTNVEFMYSTCNVIILDLYELNVNNELILQLNQIFDQLIISAKNENKTECLRNLVDLYSLIPKYMENYIPQNPEVYIKYTKSNLLKAYYFAEIENWTEASNSLAIAEQTFANIINNIEFNQNRDSRVNKVYISLKELQNSMQKQDKEIFLIKYKVVVEELTEL